MPDPPADRDAPPAASITIHAGLDRLAAVRAFVRAQTTPAGADAETTADVVQAVDELVCNILEHGYPVEEADASLGPLVGRPKTGLFRLYDVGGLAGARSVAASVYERVAGVGGGEVRGGPWAGGRRLYRFAAPAAKA